MNGGPPADRRIATPLSASQRSVAAVLLLAFVVQAAIAATLDSVTIDEFGGLPVGLHALRTGEFGVPSTNPPFFRMAMALPVAAIDFAPPESATESFWAMGYQFMRLEWRRYHSTFVLARLVAISIAALLGGFVFLWAVELYGARAGLIALTFFCFSPSMLAHGHLVTPDVAAALGFAFGVHRIGRFVDRPRASSALLAGASVGGAALIKLHTLALVPILLCVVGLRVATGRWPRADRWLAWTAVSMIAAVTIINAAYGFEGTLRPLHSMSFESGGALSRLADALPNSRLPLPQPYLRTLDMALAGERPNEPSFFLAGELSRHGWRYYHVIAFLLKTPIPLLLAGMAAIVVALVSRRDRPSLSRLLLPVAWVFVINALANPANIGVRHALMAEPLLFIAAGGALARLSDVRAAAPPMRLVLVGTLLAWYAIGCLAVAPRYLQYFNEAAGGPNEGHRWLIDSNVDWGQDLLRLHDFLSAAGVDSINLAHFGRVDPAVYGIDFRPVEPGVSRGWTVVSATLLMGRPYWVWQHPGKVEWAHAGRYAWLQERTPIARIGALFLYDVDEK